MDVKEDLLPWRRGTSDDQILRLKEKALSKEDGGAFWKSLLRGEGNTKYSRAIMEQ